MIPQFIVIAVGLIGLGMNIAKHGEPKDSKYNAWIHIIALAISWTILGYGGFWANL